MSAQDRATPALNPPQLVLEPPLLTMQGVSRRYGPVTALEEVSVTVHPGEVLGVVGESGSGKSTLLRLMNLEDAADAGDYRLALPESPGNLFELGRYERRMLRARRIGIVYQNPHLGLLMRHTSSGNVAERLLVAGERRFAALRARAREALDASEFPLDRLDARPIEFSGGMQQRVQLAKAVALEPGRAPARRAHHRPRRERASPGPRHPQAAPAGSAHHHGAGQP